MKKDWLLLLVPTLFLVGVGAWFWAFPPTSNLDLNGPLRAVLVFQRPSSLTKQEKFERCDTKVFFQFAMRGTPDLPAGFSYTPAKESAPSVGATTLTYTLAARNYRFVAVKNGVKTAHGQNGYGVLRNFTWRSGHLLDGTILAKAHRAPGDSENFLAFDLIAESWNLTASPNKLMGVYALNLKSQKLVKWS